MGEEGYTPWPAEPLEAKAVWYDRSNLPAHGFEGHLHFYGPDGQRAAIPVTFDHVEQVNGNPVWHIEILDSVATITPSIHALGLWHSPNPVQFRLVHELTRPR
jgi:hypothetical protein